MVSSHKLNRGGAGGRHGALGCDTGVESAPVDTSQGEDFRNRGDLAEHAFNNKRS